MEKINMQTTDVVDIRIEQELKEILETQGVRNDVYIIPFPAGLFLLLTTKVRIWP